MGKEPSMEDNHWFISENEAFGLKQMGSLSLPPTVAATDPPTIQPTYLTDPPTVTATDPPTYVPTFLTDPPTVTATDPPTAKTLTKPPTSPPTAAFCENIGANSETEYNARLEEIYEEVSFAGAFDGTDVDRLNALRFIRDEQFCAEPPRLIQRYVAALFFYATVGADWTETKGWLGPAHECEWFKLECNDDLQITRIGVDENGLAGTVAPELCALPKLRSIDLDDNKITGTIPEIGACRSLKVLDLDNNQLTGSLPDSLYTIGGMTSIDVDTNSLTGVLNPKIGDLINLEYLAINGNAFTGQIPQELQSLQQLKIAYLDNNEFTGAVAPEICELTTEFDLVEITTDCSGDAPKVQCSCCLNCSGSGSESELRLRRIIEEMAVTISGGAATEQGTPQQRAVAWLQDDAVKNRREDVTSPCGLRQRYAATVLYFSFGGDGWIHGENYLTDADECEWKDQVSFTKENGEEDTKTVGLVCDARIEDGTCITRIMLGDNELAGGFPEEITSLNNLILIDMDENAITGTIPPSIGNRLPNLRVFDLDNNQLTGTLPSSLFKEQIKIVDVDTNLLQGPLLGLNNAPNLEYLSLYGNQMTGPLPSAAFAQMTQLETLYLDDNQFTGSLDQKVCDLTAGSLNNLMVDCSITRPSEENCGECN
eukprot:CAMPEP_0194266224 /NCGR_PEP_ID=MMETSP0169-20130528/1196_1 /TAXON_ID=218684 /ORGANISM="Corethron pennatum, Strain L29A3" /LENGTH=653 /DNA_ID=CAMNT_0039006857 /DNA_START=286 /DNA_END=2247 /DNA_ORIENTATION=-